MAVAVTGWSMLADITDVDELLSGQRREGNFFYQLLTVLTRPFTAAARWIAPRQVADHHVPLVAFFLLSIVWAVVTFERIRHCISVNMVGCQ